MWLRQQLLANQQNRTEDAVAAKAAQLAKEAETSPDVLAPLAGSSMSWHPAHTAQDHTTAGPSEYEER